MNEHSDTCNIIEEYSESLVFKTYPWGVIHSLDMGVLFT